MINSIETLRVTELLIAFALLLQTIELLTLRSSFSDIGVWRYQDLRKDFSCFPQVVANVMTFFFTERRFLFLLFSRLMLSVAAFLFSSPIIFFLLLVSSILVCLRFRGTFNGGSDYMTVVILVAVFVASFSKLSTTLLQAGLWYIAIQVTLSYFIAGVVKVLKSSWRNGTALSIFLFSSPYKIPTPISQIFKQKPVMLLASWAVIMFECAAPLVFFIDGLVPMYLTLAILFHLGTVYFFGLNRFFFAWLSGYPALYFCATTLTR